MNTITAGRYLLQGYEICDSNARYGTTINLRLKENGYLDGTVNYNHENGDEGLTNSHFSGTWDENGEFEYRLYYSGQWYTYEGVITPTSYNANFWESEWEFKYSAPYNRRGSANHTVSRN